MMGEREKSSSVAESAASVASDLTAGETTCHSEGDVVRDISGETVCGFRVAAYRETHPEHGDKYGHSYSEHWSTPSKNPAIKVERLFTEAQLRSALRLSRLTHADLCRLSIVFGRSSDLRTDQDIRINEWLKAEIAALSKAEPQS